jgi:membrane protease YdiL (CAAX protease family)
MLRSVRLVWWAVLVAALAAANYVQRFGHSHSSGRDLYKYSAAAGGALSYTLVFAFVYAIAAVDTNRYFALRRPDSWRRAVGLGAAVIAGIYAWSAIVSTLPLPKSPGKEQGLVPDHWEPHFAKQYAANFVVIALVAPFVEELAFRGLGYRLMRDARIGRFATIVAIGIAFGLAHGLVEGLLVLVPFGSALAYLRDRTDSTLPGMAVHCIFNSIALITVIAS